MRLSLHECIIFFPLTFQTWESSVLQYFLRKENPFSPKLILMGTVWVGAQVLMHLHAPRVRDCGFWAPPAPLTSLWAERKW